MQFMYNVYVEEDIRIRNYKGYKKKLVICSKKEEKKLVLHSTSVYILKVGDVYHGYVT